MILLYTWFCRLGEITQHLSQHSPPHPHLSRVEPGTSHAKLLSTHCTVELCTPRGKLLLSNCLAWLRGSQIPQISMELEPTPDPQLFV